MMTLNQVPHRFFVGLLILISTLPSSGLAETTPSCWKSLIARCSQVYWRCAQGPAPETLVRLISFAPKALQRAYAQVSHKPHPSINPFFFAPADRQSLSEWSVNWRRYYNINSLIAYSDHVEKLSNPTYSNNSIQAAREGIVRDTLDVEMPGWSDAEEILLFSLEAAGATLYAPSRALPIRFPKGSYVVLSDYVAVGVVLLSDVGPPRYISYGP